MRLYNLLLNKIDHLRFWILKHQFDPVDVLLDIGSGNNPQDVIDVTKIFYTADPSYAIPKSEMLIHVMATWEQVMKMIPKGYVHTVTLMDVIEHIEKQEALRLLNLTKEYVNQIVIFTPYGFLDQVDDENPWNTHRSGWYPEDFGDGWEVVVFQHFHWCDFKGNVFDKPKGAMLAVWEK